MDQKEIQKKIQNVIDSMKDDVYTLGPELSCIKDLFEDLLVLDLKSKADRDIAIEIIKQIIDISVLYC